METLNPTHRLTHSLTHSPYKTVEKNVTICAIVDPTLALNRRTELIKQYPALHLPDNLPDTAVPGGNPDPA